MFFDIHSHKVVPTLRKVINLIVPSDGQAVCSFEEGVWYSVGIHPWYIQEERIEAQCSFLEKMASREQVKFIGECGLDRLKGPSFAVQKTVFLRQIDLAEALRKPVIVHCVRYFNELIELVKKRPPKIPLIVHGYNKNAVIAGQLLDKDLYLSFGAAVLRHGGQLAKVVAEVPLDRIFLETDESSVAIEDIYEAVARIRKIPLLTLTTQLEENLERILHHE